jgi:DNA end-binding protein Ku
MATSLIDAMTQRFDPAAHHDRYPAALDTLIRMKVSGTPEQGLPDDEPSEAGSPQPDLAESLRASLAAAKYRQAGV